MPHQNDVPEDTEETTESRRSFRVPLGARKRRDPGGPSLQEEVQGFLNQVARRGGEITRQQVVKSQEAVEAAPEEARPDVFRFAKSSELQDTADMLARRMKGGADPSESDLNAALVMILDAEDQRRILFEQRSGVRTPDPITGASSLDDPNALDNLARSTGVGADVPRPGISGNIRAFFDLP